MTSTRYIICLLGHAFGYRRKNIRMTDAASEMHLLKEAESCLGKAVWEKVADIEQLSVEYWNLRKLITDRTRVAAELKILHARLTEAHDERASLLNVSNEPYMELLEERQGILIKLEELTRARDHIVARAREVRRNYEGIKTKEEVLTKEGKHTLEESLKITERLAQLKKEFTALKIERQEVAEKIAQGDAKINEIKNEIERRKYERREMASEAFQHIGDANQQISTLRAELGVLDTRMRQLYTEIGKHVSRSAANDPLARKACKAEQGLVHVMGALRKSIFLNQKLAER